jgi:hypothetical protein
VQAALARNLGRDEERRALPDVGRVRAPLLDFAGQPKVANLGLRIKRRQRRKRAAVAAAVVLHTRSMLPRNKATVGAGCAHRSVLER